MHAWLIVAGRGGAAGAPPLAGAPPPVKEIVKAYMDVGYQGILSIENEDPILPGEVGVQRALYVLKNVREELLNAPS